MPERHAFRHSNLPNLFLLAGLVGNAAAGLAGALAGSLALAAAAVFGAGAKVPGFEGLNMLHVHYLRKI